MLVCVKVVYIYIYAGIVRVAGLLHRPKEEEGARLAAAAMKVYLTRSSASRALFRMHTVCVCR